MALAELAINNHNTVVTEVSLFFLSHKYYIESVQIRDEICTIDQLNNLKTQDKAIIQK